MSELRTMHYCETCRGIVTGGESHDCKPGLLARIAELGSLYAMVSDVLQEQSSHVAVLERSLDEAMKRIAELEAEIADLRKHSIRLLPAEKRPDLEFPPEYYESGGVSDVSHPHSGEKCIAELERELALTQRAVRLAIEDWEEVAHPWSEPGEPTLEQYIVYYIERARKQKERVDEVP